MYVYTVYSKRQSATSQRSHVPCNREATCYCEVTVAFRKRHTWVGFRKRRTGVGFRKRTNVEWKHHTRDTKETSQDVISALLGESPVFYLPSLQLATASIHMQSQGNVSQWHMNWRVIHTPLHEISLLVGLTWEFV